jgi:hypothetical protein
MVEMMVIAILIIGFTASLVMIGLVLKQVKIVVSNTEAIMREVSKIGVSIRAGIIHSRKE